MSWECRTNAGRPDRAARDGGDPMTQPRGRKWLRSGLVPETWPTDAERAAYSAPGQFKISSDSSAVEAVPCDERDPWDGRAEPPTLDRPMDPFRAEMARDPTTKPWECGCGEVLGWSWAGGTRLGIMDPGTGDVFVVVEAGGVCDVVCSACRTGSSRRVTGAT